MSATLKQEDITPDFIIATAERVGIKLRPRMYLDRVNRCGCAVTVLAFAVNPELAAQSKCIGSGVILGTLVPAGLSESFVCGIANGFDGYSRVECTLNDADHLAGYNVGRATRLKFDPKFAADHPGETVA